MSTVAEQFDRFNSLCRELGIQDTVNLSDLSGWMDGDGNLPDSSEKILSLWLKTQMRQIRDAVRGLANATRAPERDEIRRRVAAYTYRIDKVCER